MKTHSPALCGRVPLVRRSSFTGRISQQDLSDMLKDLEEEYTLLQWYVYSRWRYEFWKWSRASVYSCGFGSFEPLCSTVVNSKSWQGCYRRELGLTAPRNYHNYKMNCIRLKPDWLVRLNTSRSSKLSLNIINTNVLPLIVEALQLLFLLMER